MTASGVMAATTINLLIQLAAAAQPLSTRAMQAEASGGLRLPTAPEGHCHLAQGDWCLKFWGQAPVLAKPPFRGSKECPAACSGVGVCNYDHGLCYCPAGFGGDDCSQPRKRPCWRMGPDKRDLGWHTYEEWSHSRCAGLCDDDIAMCYCPPETKYGFKAAPPGSKLGAPPVRRGRPLYWCQPSTDEHNKTVKWGAMKYEDLFGPNGWCNADVPNVRCPCRIDGVVGETCNIPVEMACMNQCSGHGECDQGFCKCYEGWYGHDCSRKKAGMDREPGDQHTSKPWLQAAMKEPLSAMDPPTDAARQRPLIYVYDLKPEFNTDIMQYRIERAHCTWREFGHGNVSQYVGYNAYAVETVLHELMLTSAHRTFDPEEADFFYVPTHAGCLFDVYGWNPIPMWPPKVHGSRPYGACNMVQEAWRWISTKFPYFNRTRGQDHIWLMPHDEGACYAPVEIWPGVILGHWGRLDFPHYAGSQYHADNYSMELTTEHHPDGWLWYSSQSHPCFDPRKDLIIPCFKSPQHYRQSPYMGGATEMERTIFIFFRGDVGRVRDDKTCQYSRCIRQTIDRLVKEQGWRAKYNIWYGDREDTPGDYSTLLASSRYCLALPGDGWSARFEDSILHGCIPIIIMDNVQVPFESILDMEKFTVRVKQADIPQLPQIIQAIPAEQEREMRARLAKVWMRFRWLGLPLLDVDAANIVNENKARGGGKLPERDGVQFAAAALVDDAFSTLLQWLHGRIPYTRGKPRQDESIFLPPFKDRYMDRLYHLVPPGAAQGAAAAQPSMAA